MTDIQKKRYGKIDLHKMYQLTDEKIEIMTGYMLDTLKDHYKDIYSEDIPSHVLEMATASYIYQLKNTNRATFDKIFEQAFGDKAPDYNKVEEGEQDTDET